MRASGDLGRTVPRGLTSRSVFPGDVRLAQREACGHGHRLDGADYRSDLQAAIEILEDRGGGLLWLPPNTTFDLYRPLTIRAGGIRIAGGGPSTRLRLRAGALEKTAIVVRPDPSGGPVHIHDLVVQGQPSHETALHVSSGRQIVRVSRVACLDFSGAAIQISGNERPVLLDELDVRRCGTGLLARDARSVFASRCRFSTMTGGCVQLGSSTAVTLTSCRFEEGRAFGVSADDGTRSLSIVDSCFVRNAALVGGTQLLIGRPRGLNPAAVHLEEPVVARFRIVTGRPGGLVSPRPVGGRPVHAYVSGCEFSGVAGRPLGTAVLATNGDGLLLHTNVFLDQAIGIALAGDAVRHATLLGNQFLGVTEAYHLSELGPAALGSLRATLDIDVPILPDWEV